MKLPQSPARVIVAYLILAAGWAFLPLTAIYLPSLKSVYEGILYGGGWLLLAASATALLWIARREVEADERSRLSRQATNRTISQTENYTRSIISSVADGVAVYDSDLHHRVWNAAMESLTGLPSEEVLGKPVSEVLPELISADLVPYLKQALQGEVVTTGDIPYQKTGNRAPGWVSAVFSPHYSTDNEVIGVIATFEETTGRKLAEYALRESELRYKRLAENAPDMIFRWSFKRGFEYVSPASELVNGYRPDEHYTDPGLVYRIVHPDDIPIYDSIFTDLTNRPSPQHHTVLRWIHKDGHEVHIELRTTPLYDHHGELIALEGIARDVSQHVLANLRLKELAQRITAAQEVERRTIATELHDDVGQALTVVKMRLKMLANASADKQPADFQDQLKTITDFVDESLATVRAISHGLRPPLLDEMGWHPALEWLCTTFASRSNIGVDFTHSGPVHRLHSDIELSAYRIVQEALTNALRHAGASALSVSTRLTGRSLTITIEDNGKGFDVQALTGAGPSGIGLLSMHERVNAAGGKLDVRSKRGHGTTIKVRLPVRSGGGG